MLSLVSLSQTSQVQRLSEKNEQSLRENLSQLQDDFQQLQLKLDHKQRELEEWKSINGNNALPHTNTTASSNLPPSPSANMVGMTLADELSQLDPNNTTTTRGENIPSPNIPTPTPTPTPLSPNNNNANSSVTMGRMVKQYEDKLAEQRKVLEERSNEINQLKQQLKEMEKKESGNTGSTTNSPLLTTRARSNSRTSSDIASKWAELRKIIKPKEDKIQFTMRIANYIDNSISNTTGSNTPLFKLSRNELFSAPTIIFQSQPQDSSTMEWEISNISIDALCGLDTESPIINAELLSNIKKEEEKPSTPVSNTLLGDTQVKEAKYPYPRCLY